jgi:UDP-N-acetylglucosamine 2-epimerase (non-hydrolysing)
VKILTILGTRPEIIRLSRVIERLDALCEHVLVHTGQNFAPSLSDVFFEELGVRLPDRALQVRGETFGAQIGRMLIAVEQVLREERPDGLLILGDTNSGLCSVLAKRMGIPVFHMEAGNRCYDDRVPEEVNRRVIDHSSSVLMPYTQRSKENLLREGIAGEHIYVTGNPIGEVLDHFAARIEESETLDTLDLRRREFVLVTMHRAENVDIDERLRGLTEGLTAVAGRFGFPVVCSLHPRTRQKMEQFGLPTNDGAIRFVEPLGLFDFVALERAAFCVVSDSGTVQEECCIFGVPAVTVRDVTERPETLECGSNMLAGADPATILRCVETVTELPARWRPPSEYLVPDVSTTVAKVVLGYQRAD